MVGRAGSARNRAVVSAIVIVSALVGWGETDLNERRIGLVLPLALAANAGIRPTPVHARNLGYTRDDANCAATGLDLPGIRDDHLATFPNDVAKTC